MRRLRVGDYRVGYDVDDKARTVRIFQIGHRESFYG
jgi:mRNA-degrading endonuclease RelE of RelBE toxin-antitoxin system